MHCPICRAALPTGSRFCNHCGNAISGAAPPPPGDRTQAMPPQQHQTQYGQTQYGQQTQYGHPAAQRPPYGAPPSSHLPPPLPVAKKPIWPWAVGGAALLATLVTAGVLYANSRKSSVLMSGLENPSTPAVVQAPRTQPKAPPITQAPNPTKPAAPVVQAPAPVDNSSFERYLNWLRFAEQEREKLTIQAGARQQQEIKEFYDLILQMGGDPGPEVDQKMIAYPDKQMKAFQDVVNSQAVFWQNIIRTKPAVPEDCKYLDFYYTEAGRISVALAEEAGRAAQARNMSGLQAALRKNALVDSNLKKANSELDKIKSVRRLRDDWMISGLSGGGGGMMPPGLLPGM